MYNLLVKSNVVYSESEEDIDEDEDVDVSMNKNEINDDIEMEKEKSSETTKNNDEIVNEVEDTNDAFVLSEGEGDSENDHIPEGYVFPSYYAFIIWGPFAPIDERLSLFLTDDRHNSRGDGSRAQTRKSVNNKNYTKQHTMHQQFTAFLQITYQHRNVTCTGTSDER